MRDVWNAHEVQLLQIRAQLGNMNEIALGDSPHCRQKELLQLGAVGQQLEQAIPQRCLPQAGIRLNWLGHIIIFKQAPLTTSPGRPPPTDAGWPATAVPWPTENEPSTDPV